MWGDAVRRLADHLYHLQPWSRRDFMRSFPPGPPSTFLIERNCPLVGRDHAEMGRRDIARGDLLLPMPQQRRPDALTANYIGLLRGFDVRRANT